MEEKVDKGRWNETQIISDVFIDIEKHMKPSYLQYLFTHSVHISCISLLDLIPDITSYMAVYSIIYCQMHARAQGILNECKDKFPYFDYNAFLTFSSEFSAFLDECKAKGELEALPLEGLLIQV